MIAVALDRKELRFMRPTTLRPRVVSWFVMLSFVSFFLSPTALAEIYTTFDIPLATQGIEVVAVNNSGQVAGWYWDAEGRTHGFLWQPNGQLTTIDIPGGSEVFIWGMNNLGKIVGSYNDANGVHHGFLRNLAGKLTTLNPPFAYWKYGSFALAINDVGQIAGEYIDQNGQDNAYLRQADGTYVAFDPPNSYQVISVLINQNGQIAGWYTSQPGGTNNEHVFLREVDGTISNFDVPGYSAPEPLALGADGSIAGIAQDAAFIYHDFLRDALGTVTVFDVPNGRANYDWPVGITDAGNLIGRFLYSSGRAYRGWQRGPGGTFTYFRDPNAGTFEYQGTAPTCASGNGKVAGLYYDSQNAIHGFVKH